MAAMRFVRPKSLSGLLLIGFALVAIPLLVAVVNATVQMRRLTQQSEALVRHGVEATRHTQELFQRATALERSARLYQVLGDEKLKDVFRQHRDSFEASLAALERVKPDSVTRQLTGTIRGDGAQLAQVVEFSHGPSAGLAHAIDEFTHVHETLATVGEKTSADINARLEALQVSAAETQRRLFWQAAALVPGTALIVLVFVSLLARPIRQIDQAISELGRGTFSRPVVVQGPSDLERLGRQLEWLRARLLDLAHEKNRFLRHMSHELKTPLANIREGTELLLEGAVGPLDQNQREVASILRENSIKLQRLIENLLSFSAWQAKAVGLELSQFSLRHLVRSVVSAQRLTLVAQRIKLDIKVQDVEITADRGKLRLILDNLLSNAVKFTPREGTIFIHGLTYKDHLILDVADTGPGIPKDERVQVFDAFYTGKTEQAGKLKGTGIGLSVVTEFVQAHGGTIELVDGVHSGAHFRIRLPARPAAVRADTVDAAADAAA
jgi:two-component system, NtrC family, sensor histidine kinase GlrK